MKAELEVLYCKDLTDPSEGHYRIGVIAIDVFTGLYAFQGVAPALYRRARTGKGAHLDVSLMQASLAFLSAKMIERHLEGPEPTLLGAPLGTYQTSDGFLNMNARRDPHFKALMEMIGRPELADDPAYFTKKVELREEMQALLEAERDPRALGNEEIFETYRYVGSRKHAYDTWLANQ